ncbi:integrase catalytic domain-containing protein [Trichonephila clavipes]|nr:integrase catalytic domain-containing protein [Trichonephila clavipes]
MLAPRTIPADLISRGCNVDELLKNEMWFSGPDLQTDEYEDNQLFPDPSYRDELKCAVTLSMTECSSKFYDELFNVTNNFIKLIRIFSFIFRFINNIKAKESCNKEKYLTADEVKRSTEFLAKIAQLSEFKAEIDALKKGKGVSKTSKLKALDPFLDENSLLRVGGRLCNADLPFEAKHQIIIPKAVTDLTTEAFIAALKRLCARRGGRISTLMSDNATNFKGATAELNRFIKLICNKNETLANYFASEAIQWKFIPPRSPNFGGLWEAGQRNKWQFEKINVAVGCLVLLKENDLPPCKWAMARILEVIFGTDGKWTREGIHVRKTRSGTTRKTTRKEDRRIVRQAHVDPTVTRSIIRAGVAVAIVPRTISRHLAEANLKSKCPFRALHLPPELRQQWCRARSMWNVTDWQKFVFSDESRFVLGTDDNRVRLWRRPGERYDSSHTVLRHTARTANHVWDQLKRQMPSCHSVHDLELAVQVLWAHLPQDNIRCLINSMPDRVAACIAAGGGPTRY